MVSEEPDNVILRGEASMARIGWVMPVRITRVEEEVVMPFGTVNSTWRVFYSQPKKKRRRSYGCNTYFLYT
jgi:hypothetical protein